MQSSLNLIKFSSHLVQLRNLILRHPWRQYVRLPGSSGSRLLLHGLRLYGSHVSFLLQLFHTGVASVFRCPFGGRVSPCSLPDREQGPSGGGGGGLAAVLAVEACVPAVGIWSTVDRE